MTHEMMDKMVGFVSGFGELIARGRVDDAVGGLVSTFATCYSMLSPEDRGQAALVLLTAISDIGEKIFEDHADFRSFLKELVDNNGELPDD